MSSHAVKLDTRQQLYTVNSLSHQDTDFDLLSLENYCIHMSSLENPSTNNMERLHIMVIVNSSNVLSGALILLKTLCNTAAIYIPPSTDNGKVQSQLPMVLC